MAEILISGVDITTKEASSKAKSGSIRKIIRGVYTTDLTTPIEDFVFKNRIIIISKIYPDVLFSHRSAFRYLKNERDIYLTWSKSSKTVDSLPGITLHLMKGPEPLDSDTKIIDHFISSDARAFLENLQSHKTPKDRLPKCIPIEEIEEMLESILRPTSIGDFDSSDIQAELKQKGEDALNRIRDEAKKVSEKLSMKTEFDKLNLLIKALLNTGTAKGVLKSPRAIAAAKGKPYDAERVNLFRNLQFHLIKDYTNPISEPRPFVSNPNNLFSFFEAYFSNYIEGTQFEVGEAKDIIYDGKDIPLRRDDSHDIRGTFDVITDGNDYKNIPLSSHDLIDLLKHRHRIILKSRPEKRPGQFKQKNNKAGNSYFVDQSHVHGTLEQGYHIYKDLPGGYCRAAFMMFLISEIHPFDDGNGRLARIMMNAELSKVNLCRIIIPTSLRQDYFTVLKAATNRQILEPFTKLLLKSQIDSSRIPLESLEIAFNYLKERNAFEEPETKTPLGAI
jgi:hypothetical protein